MKTAIFTHTESLYYTIAHEYNINTVNVCIIYEVAIRAAWMLCQAATKSDYKQLFNDKAYIWVLGDGSFMHT